MGSGGRLCRYLGPARWCLLARSAVVLLHRYRRGWFYLARRTGRPNDARDAVYRWWEDTPTVRRSHSCLHHVLQPTNFSINGTVRR